MSYKVEVTTEDIKAGKRFGIDDGFLSIAIKRAFNAEEADVYKSTFHVRKNGRGQTYNLPQEAATALYNFDYDILPVQPFSFTIEVWAFASV